MALAGFTLLVVVLAFRELARRTAMVLVSFLVRMVISLVRAVSWLLVGWWAQMLWRRHIDPSW